MLWTDLLLMNCQPRHHETTAASAVREAGAADRRPLSVELTAPTGTRQSVTAVFES
jgi:hypothetical protein